jgi:hypothetical protein
MFTLTEDKVTQCVLLVLLRQSGPGLRLRAGISGSFLAAELPVQYRGTPAFQQEALHSKHDEKAEPDKMGSSSPQSRTQICYFLHRNRRAHPRELAANSRPLLIYSLATRLTITSVQKNPRIEKVAG